MQHSMSDSSAKGGAHTAFKEQLKHELLGRVGNTVRNRAGPSWDERMAVSVKAFKAKATVVEGEAKKTLQDSIEKGRSRATSCPIRSSSETPNQNAMLQQRKKKMKELEMEYKETLDHLKDKMEKREPLFRLSEVNAAFAMQRERMLERKRAMTQDEHERWEHLRSMEQNAASRPLLIEDSSYRAPKKTPASTSVPGEASAIDKSMDLNPHAVFGGREEYEKDKMIREAVSQRWFTESDWGKQVQGIKDKVNARQKLHEVKYPNKGDRHELTRNRLMHALPAQVPGVY